MILFVISSLVFLVDSHTTESVVSFYGSRTDARPGLYTEPAWLDTRKRCQHEEYKLETSTGKCYKFHSEPKTWYKAYVACHEENSELTIINSEEEARILKEMLENNLAFEAIVGVRKMEGEWVTLDGETLAEAGFNSWAPGEPNNRKGDETCGYLLSSGLLYDDPCDKFLPFICEMEFY